MSGHSKWDNIKRKKGAEDQKRGKIFSKFARQIVAAIKEGGSADPETNTRLRGVIDKAKACSMPKNRIDRLLQKGKGRSRNLQSFSLEGYGPVGIAVLLEVLSDNRQRTTQELKSLFRRYGGSLAEPGAVAFQFEKIAMVKTGLLEEEEILSAGEWGAGDFEQEKDGVVFCLPWSRLANFKKALSEHKVNILSSTWLMKAKNPVLISSDQARSFLEEIEGHKDISRVFTNLG